ncbi:hypothetical protein ACIRP3_13420 [Streptomyces sp. NPDC101209]|uniref:hypothetical protein n=1 Tax=Streptomyces sp. NPDC101209 TaxID=3366129 RepID=UPI003819ED0D
MPAARRPTARARPWIEAVVGLLRAGLDPRPQRLEHLVLLAAPQGAVEGPEVRAAGVAGDPHQGAQRPVHQFPGAARGVLAQHGHGERAQPPPGLGRGVAGLDGVGGDPVQVGRGVFGEQGRRGVGEGAQRGRADRVLFVAQAFHVPQDGGDGGRVAPARGVADQQRPGLGPVLGGRTPGGREQPLAHLGDGQEGLGEQHRGPAGPALAGPVRRLTCHVRRVTAGQDTEDGDVDGVGVPASFVDGGVQRLPPAGREGLQQGRQSAVLDQRATVVDEFGPPGAGEAAQDGRAQRTEADVGPRGREQQAQQPAGIGGREPPCLAAEFVRHTGGSQPFQQPQHPRRRGGRDRGHRVAVARPPGPAQRRRQTGELLLQDAEQDLRVPFRQCRPRADGVQEPGQQPLDGAGRAAGQQAGRLGVAPLLAQRVDEPVGERAAPGGDHRAQQVPAHGLAGVRESRLEGAVRDPKAAGHPQSVTAYEGVGVGDARGDEAGVAPDGRGDDGELPAVGAPRLELLQKRSQGCRLPDARGEFPHAVRVGQRVEGVEQALGLLLRGEADHAGIVPAHARVAGGFSLSERCA